MSKKQEPGRQLMTGKAKTGFRAYVAAVLAVALLSTLCAPAFAAAGDPVAVVNKLSDFIFVFFVNSISLKKSS